MSLTNQSFSLHILEEIYPCPGQENSRRFHLGIIGYNGTVLKFDDVSIHAQNMNSLLWIHLRNLCYFAHYDITVENHNDSNTNEI